MIFAQCFVACAFVQLVAFAILVTVQHFKAAHNLKNAPEGALCAHSVLLTEIQRRAREVIEVLDSDSVVEYKIAIAKISADYIANVASGVMIDS